MVNASAYINENRLFVVGVCGSPWGDIPVHFEGDTFEAEQPSGPVDPDDTALPEPVAKALDAAHDKIMTTVNERTMALAAENLVERARTGDQIAMSTIIMVRENAKKGNKRAEQGLASLKSYAESHPVGSDTRYMAEELRDLRKPKAIQLLKSQLAPHGEPLRASSVIMAMLPAIGDVEACALVLANGESLLGPCPLIDSLMSHLKNPVHQKAFAWAAKNHHKVPETLSQVPKDHLHPVLVGQAIGRAIAIQSVRLPGTPLSTLNPMVGWEHGE